MPAALLHKVGAQTATHFAATENRNGAWLTVSDGVDKKGAPCTHTFDAKRHYLADELVKHQADADTQPAPGAGTGTGTGASTGAGTGPPHHMQEPPMQPPPARGLSASTFTFVG